MLENIKRIIPVVDPSSEEKVYQFVKEKIEEKKPIRLNNKFALVFSMAVLLIVSIPLTIFMINSTDNNTNNNIDIIDDNGGNANTGSKYNSQMYNSMNLIAMAAYSEFDRKETNSLCSLTINLNNEELSSSTSSNVYYPNTAPKQVSYPFTHIRIVDATKFNISADNIVGDEVKEVIKTSCGLGDLEVVIANFVTYDQNNSGYSIENQLISIRGYNGYYTILRNSHGFLDGVKFSIYSSHCTLEKKSINKDMKPPFVSIIVTEEDDSRYVFFESKSSFGKYDDFNKDYAFKSIGEIENVSRGTLYSVLELVDVEEKENEGIITRIITESELVYFETEANTTIIKIVDYTEGLKITDLNVGDKVIYTYDYYYDGYNPDVINANSIKFSKNNG